MNNTELFEISICIDILTKELEHTFDKAYGDWSVRDHNLIEALCELESRKEELSCSRR